MRGGTDGGTFFLFFPLFIIANTKLVHFNQIQNRKCVFLQKTKWLNTMN
ncbi:hypothetical protein BACCOP_03243 [Phocaeicola coprocola DSM 17136]|uniref:Uncharacterized protein n=1 Tax=Phocaeicola coprocola DSM 17136 TaxID=470145 RepID=B3JMT9_9BACT|nr:hypothetical protein BACCOP_03243 [Phocaeicola coprocola DSM 17136]